jgi:hypothetical protein
MAARKIAKFGVRWKKGHMIRHYRARRKVTTRVKREPPKMVRICAIDYQILVRKNLTSEKFKWLYPQYDKNYATYKLRAVGHLKTWRLFDDLLNNLTAFKITSGTVKRHAWMGGIPDHVMNRDGKNIAMYGKTVEYGPKTKKYKKRPLFIPTAHEYARAKWGERGQEALNRVKSKWA